MSEPDARRAFYMDLARIGGEREVDPPPPGVAGKRLKPWLKKREILSRTLREIRPFDDAFFPEVADLWVASWAKTMPSIDFEARRSWFVDHIGAALDAGRAVRVAVVETRSEEHTSELQSH